MAFLTPGDLEPFATIDPVKAQALIDDVEALAVLAAPCINNASFAHANAVKAILRGVVLRWNEAGTGALQSQTAGPFGMTLDTRQRGGHNLWPSDITALQSLCADARAGAYTVSLDASDPVA